jgi:hypothetical protein
MEYRYWSFIEAHPAHTSLPGNARVEAMDALSWAYAGLLLQFHAVVPNLTSLILRPLASCSPAASASIYPRRVPRAHEFTSDLRWYA